MKDIIDDYKSEKFTVMDWLLYGVAYPMGLIILCLIF